MMISCKSARQRLRSVAAVVISATILFSGTVIRSSVSATSGVPDQFNDFSTEGVGRAILSEEVPMTVGNATLSRTSRSIAVYIDGKEYSGNAFLYKDTTYVGIREFSTALTGANVTWNKNTETATAKTSIVTVSATKGKEYISANGRYFWARTGIIIRDDTMYVPIRPLCLAYGASITWDGSAYTVSVKKGNGTVESGASFYDSDEVYWLSKIIHAESRGESMTGKIAVGNVVLNRVRSKDYPNTIYGVIFDRKYGVQFSPVADGTIHLEPDTDSVIAAKLCLEGYTVSTSILFFINKNIATNMWVTNTRPLAVSIGKHDFYA